MSLVSDFRLSKSTLLADDLEKQRHRNSRVPSRSRKIVARICVTLICVLVAFGIRLWLSPILGEDLPFMGFVAASLIASWYGGAIMGIIALVMGLLLGDVFFTSPTGKLGINQSIELIQFIRYLITASLGVVLT